MHIIDAHTHIRLGDANPRQLLEQMDSIGIDGCTLFSIGPKTHVRPGGLPYEERMDQLQAWTEGYTDRLFPFLFIDPMDPAAPRQAQEAVKRGVMGFKIICDHHYVYEDPCMELLREIAKLDKPVMFHSGILWNGGDSSKYNRPLHWESLITIPGLRFSMGHCSWPWTDECIALYGKFLNAYAKDPTISAEMFLDLTPGTPAIYRQDLIYKLLNAGYDTPHNLLFGTDCSANDYNTKWSDSWIQRDSQLFTQFGASEKIQQLYFSENFKRFLGLIPKDFQHVSPVPDCADAWSLEYANATIK